MARVETHQPSATIATVNADEQAEQIAEQKELLVHVLDEISSLKAEGVKEAVYQNTRRCVKSPTRGAKGKRRHVTEESDEEDSEEEEAEMTDNKGRSKKSAATAALTTTPPRRGIDFSGCF
jgi:hypothetical protein